MYHSGIISASQNIPAQEDLRDTLKCVIAIRLLSGCRDLETGEPGAPDLGFLELGPSMSGSMPVLLTLVPSMIRAVGSHWAPPLALPLPLLKLCFMGNGLGTWLSHLVQQLVHVQPGDNTQVLKFHGPMERAPSAGGRCPPA